MTMAQLAEEMTADYLRNLSAMSVDTIDHFPKATDNIEAIIQLTQAADRAGVCVCERGGRVF